jgi:anti-sigma28 factor (negative regulator of flagellin synthesis)
MKVICMDLTTHALCSFFLTSDPTSTECDQKQESCAREERALHIAALKELIEQGKYHFDSKEVAMKLAKCVQW